MGSPAKPPKSRDEPRGHSACLLVTFVVGGIPTVLLIAALIVLMYVGVERVPLVAEVVRLIGVLLGSR